MAKLHELLAVEGNLETQGNKCRQELTNTFDKKRHLFGEQRMTFTPNTEGEKPTTEEQNDIQTTVASELEWVSKILAKSIDISHQVDVANTLAKADVVDEDGTTILVDMPATSLLQLEKRVKEIHDLMVAIPTLDPARGFKQDDQRPKGIYRARDITKSRTKKIQRPLELSPATDKHPAQVQLITEDVVVGTLLGQEWSSLLTPAIKADLIDRCDILLRAIKKARAKANEQEVNVESYKIGKKLLDYVLKPISG